MPLLSLPTELLVQSLKLLPHDDLARLMMVCTGLRDVIRETASLQYAFLLGLNGMQDGAGAMDTATRLARLRQYETDMRQLRFSATIIPIPARDPIYKVAGDTIAYMTDDEGTKRLDFVRTPSHLRGVGDTIKWRVDCPVGIREFFIEPSQNLLVVLRIHSLIHCDIQSLDMSNGRPHPLAHDESWTCELEDIPLHISAYVFADKLAISFGCESSTSFRLWNWQTGEAYALPTFAQESACCILDPQHIAVAVVAASPRMKISTIDIIRVKSPSTTEHILSLRLPQYRTAAKDKFMRWVWDGVPASRDHECTDRNSSTSGCFASRPHSRPLGLQISSGRSTSTLPMFIISTTSLLRLSRAGDHSLQQQSFRTVDWADWGPQATRLFLHKRPLPTLPDGPFRGTRYTVLHESPGPSPGFHVFDFACDKYRTALALGEKLEGQLVTRPSTHELHGLFSSAITTRLPYYRAYQELQHDATAPFVGVLSIDDGVVLVQAQEGDEVTLTAFTA